MAGIFKKGKGAKKAVKGTENEVSAEFFNRILEGIITALCKDSELRTTEGILRISGSQDKIQKCLDNLINNPETLDDLTKDLVSKEINIHNMIGVYKLALNNYKAPNTAAEVIAPLVETIESSDSQQQLDTIQNKLKENGLVEVAQILHNLLELGKLVAVKLEKELPNNKMEPHAVAVVLAPQVESLLHKAAGLKVDDPLKSLSTGPLYINAIETFLKSELAKYKPEENSESVEIKMGDEVATNKTQSSSILWIKPGSKKYPLPKEELKAPDNSAQPTITSSAHRTSLFARFNKFLTRVNLNRPKVVRQEEVEKPTTPAAVESTQEVENSPIKAPAQEATRSSPTRKAPSAAVESKKEAQNSDIKAPAQEAPRSSPTRIAPLTTLDRLNRQIKRERREYERATKKADREGAKEARTIISNQPKSKK